jgi:hypothetical protein
LPSGDSSEVISIGHFAPQLEHRHSLMVFGTAHPPSRRILTGGMRARTSGISEYGIAARRPWVRHPTVGWNALEG